MAEVYNGFKVGDKVKIPKTRNGKTYQKGQYLILDRAIENNQEYLYVIDPYTNRVYLSDKKDGEDELYFKYDLDNLELYEENPAPKFKVGDFITAEPWKFPLKIIKLDSGNGQFETIKADGYEDKDIYYIVPESAVLFDQIPQFEVGDKIINPTTQNGTDLGGSAKTLIDKSNNEKLGYLVVTNVTYNRYGDDLFNYWLGFKDLPNASVSFNDEDNLKLYSVTPEKPEPKYKIGDRVIYSKKPLDNFKVFEAPRYNYSLKKWVYKIESESIRSYSASYEDEMSLIEKPEPKFKIGDKVKIPKTRWGTPIDDLGFNFIERAKKNNQDFLFINDIFYKDDGTIHKVWLWDEINSEDDVSFRLEDNIELYEKKETPEPKFKIGDIVKSIDGKEFRQYEILTVNFGVDEYVYYVKRVGTEAYVTYTESELELISKAPIDCEADPSLIVSGQVKKFYDLNKPRIEKLKSEFSCKIIKALVSLSDYEKCGAPSKIKLPTAKEVLLSEIKNLKF